MPVAAPSPTKILIVEDDENDAFLLQYTLKEAGFHPSTMSQARRLDEALGLLDGTPFDVVISDLNLPDSQGLETFRRLYARVPETPIILLTGFESEALGVEAVRSGAQEYIVKGGLNGKMLKRIISYAIERNSLRRELNELVGDLQKTQEQLQAAHLQLIQTAKMETVGRLAAGVAHEVKNPLQILFVSLDYLRQKLKERDAALDGVLNEMDNATRRADRIIRGLLNFSTRDELVLKTQDLNQLVNKALLLVKHQVILNQVNLRAELSDALPEVAIDGNKIEQVLVNLLTNAVDAMPQGGDLTVKTRTERICETHRQPGSREAGVFYANDEVLIVEIVDTGSGIPPEVLGKIFDPFFTTKATGRGTGLGLAIAKTIIDLHGGEIQITNHPAGGAHAQLMFKIPKK